MAPEAAEHDAKARAQVLGQRQRVPQVPLLRQEERAQGHRDGHVIICLPEMAAQCAGAGGRTRFLPHARLVVWPKPEDWEEHGSGLRACDGEQLLMVRRSASTGASRRPATLTRAPERDSDLVNGTCGWACGVAAAWLRGRGLQHRGCSEHPSQKRHGPSSAPSRRHRRAADGAESRASLRHGWWPQPRRAAIKRDALLCCRARQFEEPQSPKAAGRLQRAERPPADGSASLSLCCTVTEQDALLRLRGGRWTSRPPSRDRGAPTHAGGRSRISSM